MLLAVAVVIEKTGSLSTWQLLLVYLVPYLLIGHDTLKEAVEGIAHGEVFNEHFLMSVATIGALCIGFIPGAETQFPEAVFVMLFFQVGELFEGYAEGQSRKSIAHLMEIRPDVARVEVSSSDTSEGREHLTGKQEMCHPEQVAVGQTIVILPGERVPLDGVVLDGTSTLDTAALTGESAPREVSTGDDIISGCINLTGTLRVRTTKSFGESTVSKIIHLVEDAGEHKSKSEAFITRFARIYTPIVVFAAIAIAVIPIVMNHLGLLPPSFGGIGEGLYRALMFLVVSCPCALVISGPLTFFGGIGGASRRGILIKGANYMDVLAKVKTIVFDKTGTLTHGEVLRQDDGTFSRVVVNDRVKEDSTEAIARLKTLGVERMVMLSGDREEMVDRVAREIGIDEYHAALLPTDKVALFERIKAQDANAITAFVGDGINDAPVLARADVGIAMGGLGSDAAIEAADVVLMDDQPSKVALAISIARLTQAIARQNVWFAIGIKVAVLLLAGFGLATMWMAVFADVGVTVLAVLNAMRALHVGKGVSLS